MIAGHPGETKEDFEDLKDFVEKSRFDRLGIFTYSHEDDTHAFTMKDDVPEKMKQQRANEIMEIQEGISLELNQEKVGKIYKVLVDRKEGGDFIGRTEFDSPEVDNEVIISSKDYLRIGDFVNVKITEASAFDLMGSVQ
jgi:ribosomal protein S12 methylthiotransferase